MPPVPMERTIALITIRPSSAAAVPAGLVKDTRAVSEVVPAVPTAMSKTDDADPAAVLAMLKVHLNMVPACRPLVGTGAMVN